MDQQDFDPTGSSRFTRHRRPTQYQHEDLTRAQLALHSHSNSCSLIHSSLCTVLAVRFLRRLTLAESTVVLSDACRALMLPRLASSP